MTYPLLDADTHYYEPEDCITRYFPKDRMGDAFRVERRGDRDVYLAGPREFTFLRDPFYSRGTMKPGGLKELLRGAAKGERQMIPVEAAFVDRDARLEVLDEQNVEAAVLLPTTGVTIEHFFGGDPNLIYPNLNAFNRWILDDWGFGADGRLFGVPLMSLADPDQAVTELEWALSNGARIIAIRPGPAYGRSPADPVFDRFWALCQEARVPVAFHISESGYNERYSADWGENPNPQSHEQSALHWTLFFGDRPIIDTLAALILHNLFGRFPDLRVVSIENGSLWVPYLLKAMDKMYKMGAGGPWLGGRLEARPSELFREHVYVSPYHEEDIGALAGMIGVDRILFGSDWPHPEGVAQAGEWLEVVQPFSELDQRRILRDNLGDLLGVS